jgi:hypothetical protein
MTLRCCLEILICVSDCLVLVGAFLEYWDVKQETTMVPGRIKFPQVFGDPIFGEWVDPEIPGPEKKLAALGWRILTIGLALELIFTALLFVVERSDDRETASRISSQEQRIERLENEVRELKAHAK